MARGKNTSTSSSKSPNRALISARWDNGLSQEVVATRADVTLRTVQRLERGHRPHPKTAKKIADVLGVKPTDLWVPNGRRAA